MDEEQKHGGDRPDREEDRRIDLAIEEGKAMYVLGGTANPEDLQDVINEISAADAGSSKPTTGPTAEQGSPEPPSDEA